MTDIMDTTFSHVFPLIDIFLMSIFAGGFSSQPN